MGILGFGQYRTVKLKIPRKCEWCEVRLERVSRELDDLKDRVNQLEANSTADQSIQLIRMKLETGTQIFSELVKGQAPVTITPAQLEGMLGLYTDIIEANDRIICDLQQGARRADQNRFHNHSGRPPSPLPSTNGHSFHPVPSGA